MKHYVTLLLLSLFAFAFTSCNDEDEPKNDSKDKLFFDEVGTHNTDNLKLEYYSIDGHCLPKSYHLTTNSEPSEITLTCTNCDVIYALHSVPCYSYYVTEKNSFDKDKTYVNEGGNWSATFINPNTIKFTFDALDPNIEIAYPMSGLSSVLEMTGMVDGETVYVSIDVKRYKEFPDWME